MSTDKRITDPNAGRGESDEARRHLSEHALSERSTAGRDRISRVGDSQPSFRDQASDLLRGIRGDLKSAGTDMTQLNLDVESGKVQAGSAAWKQRMQLCEQKYDVAIQNADKILTPELKQRIDQEQKALLQQAQVVDAARRAGRVLTPEEMQTCGVKTNDPTRAMDQLQQAALTLEDLSRESGYTRANKALAEIRGAANLPETDKQAQVKKGQDILQEAAGKDPKMYGPPPDPNFEKHLKTVVKITTGQDVNLSNGDAQVPGGDGKNASMSQDGKFVKDGGYTLPTGQNASDGDKFQNPFTIIKAVDESLSSPMSKDNINGYQAAIQAADNIDRGRLVQKMQAERDYIDRVLAGPNGDRIGSIMKQMADANDLMDKQHKQMAQWMPDLMKGPNGQQNPDAVAMLQKLQNLGTVQDINAFMRDPRNAADVQKFQNLPHGAEFISTLQGFRNNQAIVKSGETEIAKYDPNFAKAQSDLQSDMALYHSSEDTRAHLVRSLVRDPANQTPENIALAQKTMQELAAINKNVLQDSEFQQMAGMLGMRPDGKGGVEVAKPGDSTTATGAGSADKINDNVIRAFQNSIATYGQVKDGQPLTAEQKAAFEAGIAATNGITAADVQAARQKAIDWAKTQGWNDQLEQQFQGLNKDLSEKFAKIDPAKQTQINDIQNKIGSLPSDPTAQQQRQNLESQLQTMGSDPNVKAWLDSRVALAQFYTKPENQKAVSARLQIEQMNQTFNGLEHGKALTEGLYGTALVRTGDKQGARPHLVEAARDQVALKMVPDIAQAIQASGDQTIATEAQQKGPIDKGSEVSPVTPGGGLTPQQFDAAVQSLGQAQDALKQVQQNGQPLPANLDAVFQSAIQKTSGIDKASLDAMGRQIQQNLLAGWDEQKEAAYKKLATDLQAAQGAISPAGKQKIQELANSIPGNDQQGQQKFDQGVRQLAGTDPTIANYVKALDAARVAHQDPGVQKRDQYEAATQQLAQLAHGKGIAETLYAAALAGTGNPQDAAKAKLVMADALKDGDLAKAFPAAQEIATKLGLAQAPADPELAKIPGFTQLQQAEAIMQDQTLTAQQRIEKAAPLYDQAVEMSKDIKINELDQKLAAIGTKMKPLDDELQKIKDDPTKVKAFLQAHPEYQTMSADADSLTNMRLQPMKARLMEAMALNAAADQLYKQGNADPAKKAELTRVGDEWNRKAATTLAGLEQADPKMWRQNPTIQGAIQQANKHELIDTTKANAMGQVMNTQKMVDFGVNGPIKGFQPLWMSMNIAGDALQLPGKVPIPGVSTALQIFPGSLGAGLSRAGEVRPGAAYALALAKNKDGAAADEMVGTIRHQMANQAVYAVGDIASSYAGVAMGKLAVDMLGSRLGPVGKFVTFAGVGLATTTAGNKTVDFAASKMFGTDQRDTAELLSHSAASFGMSWGLQGLANYKANASANFLSGAEASAARPSFLDSMAVWNEQAGVSMTKFRFMSGVDSQVPVAFKENYLALNPAGKSAVGNALQAKFSATEFAALNPTQQYSALLNAYKTATASTAAEMVGGSKLMGGLPFSGNAAAAREALGTVDNPWMFSGKGKLAWNFGTGAAGMGVYGLGEVNPLLTNKQTGEKYTFGDMLKHSATNMAWGGFGSAAAPLVGKAMEYTVQKPIQYGLGALGKPLGWIFDSEAAAAGRAAWAGFKPVETQGARQLASTFTGNWTLVGDGAARAAVNRFALTGGLGAGAGFLTHNPWMTNPETGKNYTWGESGMYAGKWGAVTGTAGVVAPYALFAGKGVVEIGKSGYNWAVPTINKAAVPAVAWAGPTINRGRAWLGTQSDKLTEPLGKAWDRGATAVSDSKAAGVARDQWSKYYNTVYAPTMLLEGNAAGAAYGYYEWGRINDEANAILAAAKKPQGGS